MDIRRKKGKVIYENGDVKQKGEYAWVVRSQSHKDTYTIRINPRGQTCTCLDCEVNRNVCKHIWAVDYFRRSKRNNKVRHPLLVGGDKHGPKRNERNADSTVKKDKKNPQGMDSSVTVRQGNIYGQDNGASAHVHVPRLQVQETEMQAHMGSRILGNKRCRHGR